MAKPAAQIRFLQFIQKDDVSRFGLFRMSDDTMTHVMGADGFWVALPQDDDDKLNDMIHHMMVDKLLPQFRQDESETFPESTTTDASTIEDAEQSGDQDSDLPER